MGVKVTKFGGSSVADGIQLEKMRKIITSDPDRRYVVVSAPGKRFDGDNKITDLLYLCLTQMENNIPCDQIFQVVCDRFTAVKLNLGLDIDLADSFDEIRERMSNGASKDYVVSRGEYLSAKVVAAYLGFDFVDVENLIMFDKRGRVMLDETDARLSAELAKHEHAVLPGFYGTNMETGDI